MKQLFLCLKGILFGISNAIPGVSGGTLAVITGVYEELIDSINNLFKNFKKSIIFLLIFGVGCLLGFFGGSKLIKICMQYCAIPTSMLFAGLVLGGVPALGEPIKDKISKKNIALAITGALVVAGLIFIPDNSKDAATELQFVDYLMLFICGFIAAVAMVTPGISGMLMFMLLGYFAIFNTAISSIFDFSNLGNNIKILLPVALGIILGIFTAAKGISVLLKKFPTGTRFVIFGFVVGSVFCVLYKTSWEPNALMIIIGCITFICGTLLSFFLEKLGKKTTETNTPDNTEAQVEAINNDETKSA